MASDPGDLIYRPGREGLAKLLGDLESEVMDVVWDRGSATVRQVHEALGSRGRDAAYTTVMTVMARLHEKGHLRRHPQGNAYCYEPVVDREEFLAGASRQIFRRLVEDLSGPVLSSFLEGLDPREIGMLEELARRLESRRSGDEGEESS